jgi:beta-lactamase regulating signal transducer with metallopeptidase domain
MTSWVLLGFAAQPAAVLAFRLALTYLAHSLLWAGATALLLCAQRGSSATRHFFWKAALFGPLLSAVLACAVTARLERAPGGVPAFVRQLALTQPSPEITRPNASGALTLLGVGAALLGALRFSGSVWQLRRRLRTRHPLQDARLLARVELLRVRMGLSSVLLSQTKKVGGPLVIGAAEVCLPEAALGALGDAELDAVLAHELAHIERRDGLWFPAASAVASVFWLNPLNAWVCARFRESAECACDDRAVELTGKPLSLARALLHVATRATFAQRLSVMPSIAHSKSALLQRVHRLTSNPPSATRLASAGERLRARVMVSVLGALLGLLGIRSARVGSPPQAQSPARGTSMPTAPPIELPEQSQRMLELARREQTVFAQLAAIEQRPASTQDGTPEATRVLELDQELRHIRATQLWLEQRAASAQR